MFWKMIYNSTNVDRNNQIMNAIPYNQMVKKKEVHFGETQWWLDLTVLQKLSYESCIVSTYGSGHWFPAESSKWV